MANDYYEEDFSGQAHGLARTAQIEALGKRVEAGFAKLPTEEQLKTDSTTSAVATSYDQPRDRDCKLFGSFAVRTGCVCRSDANCHPLPRGEYRRGKP